MKVSLKARFPDVLIGFLFAVAMFAFGFAIGHVDTTPRDQSIKAQANSASNYRQKPEPFSVDWLTEDGTVFFTGTLALIAFVQAGLFVWQLIFMGKGVGDAHDAAVAAKTNAEAVIEAERARLFVNIRDSKAIAIIQRQFGYDHPSSGPMKLGLPPITYCFKNYGKTPAFIHELGHGHLIDVDLPPERTFSLEVPLPVDFVLGPGDLSAEVTAPLNMVTLSTVQSIRNLETTFWFYGYVIYGDSFGSRFRLDWVWHFSGVSNGFRTFSYRETKQENSGD